IPPSLWMVVFTFCILGVIPVFTVIAITQPLRKRQLREGPRENRISTSPNPASGPLNQLRSQSGQRGSIRILSMGSFVAILSGVGLGVLAYKGILAIGLTVPVLLVLSGLALLVLDALVTSRARARRRAASQPGEGQGLHHPLRLREPYWEYFKDELGGKGSPLYN